MWKGYEKAQEALYHTQRASGNLEILRAGEVVF